MARRHISNEFLRDCMAQALFRLLREKPMESISVSEITRLAGVGRATYYRNFSSKEEILQFKMQHLWREWRRAHPMPEERRRDTVLLSFFQFLRSVSDYLQVIVDNDLAVTVFVSFCEHWMGQAADGSCHMFHRAFQAFGIMGVVFEWIKGDMKETPEQLTEITLGYFAPR